jgi:hypothetical protein
MGAGLRFEDGTSVSRENPHPAFDRLRANGYVIEYRIEREVEFCTDLLVRVRRGQDVVAEADFTEDDLGAYCQNVRVNRDHRRRGVANAIYVFAEKAFGKPLYNFWGTDPKQTAAAKALRAQPHRPFGNPPSSE